MLWFRKFRIHSCVESCNIMFCNVRLHRIYVTYIENLIKSHASYWHPLVALLYYIQTWSICFLFHLAFIFTNFPLMESGETVDKLSIRWWYGLDKPLRSSAQQVGRAQPTTMAYSLVFRITKLFIIFMVSLLSSIYMYLSIL